MNLRRNGRFFDLRQDILGGIDDGEMILRPNDLSTFEACDAVPTSRRLLAILLDTRAHHMSHLSPRTSMNFAYNQ